jgi:hypothetical protein
MHEPVAGSALQLMDQMDRLKMCVLFFAFPDSRSANLPIAISLAKAATAYGEQEIAGRTLHFAGFTQSVEDLERAAELLRLAGNWKGTLTRVAGKLVGDALKAYLTIVCYLEARRCVSQSAHCHIVIDDPFHPEFDPFSNQVKPLTVQLASDLDTIVRNECVKQYVFPCKRMLMHSLFHTRFEFSKEHLATPAEYIQASAVESAIDICPFFDPFAFQECGSRNIERLMPIKDGTR